MIVKGAFSIPRPVTSRTLVNSTEQPELRSVGLGSSDRQFSPLYKAPAGHINYEFRHPCLHQFRLGNLDLWRKEKVSSAVSRHPWLTVFSGYGILAYVSVFGLTLKGRFMRTDTPDKKTVSFSLQPSWLSVALDGAHPRPGPQTQSYRRYKRSCVERLTITGE